MHFPGSLKHAKSCHAGRVIDDVGAAGILAEGDLFSLSGILERFPRVSGIPDQDGAIRVYIPHALAIPRFEFLNERRLHSANESENVGLRHQACKRTDKE